MARSPVRTEEIVFEDLHGVADDDDVTLEVDLDSTEGDGITKHARTSSEDGSPTDPVFDNLTDRSGKRTAADDDPDADGRDDDQGGEGRFSKKFRKRLDRSARLTRSERKRADDAEADNARLRRENQQLKRDGKKDDTADLDRQIATAETDLEQAIENGKSGEQVRLTGKLTDLKAERIAAKYVDPDDGGDDPADAPRNRQEPKPPSEAEEDWRDEHAAWYEQPGFERETRMARRLSNAIFREDYSSQDPEYFEELNARLKEKAPELFDGSLDDELDADRGNRHRGRRQPRDSKRSPVAAADDSSRDGKNRRNPNKVELGEAEFANMRRFGLDPTNAAHIKEYAANKRQIEREEA